MTTPFSPYTALAIAGKDNQRFLQGQFTYDLRQLDSASYAFTALCNTQGQVIVSGWLTQKEDTFYWIIPSTLAPIAYTTLQKYAHFSAVTLSITSLKVNVVANEAHTSQLQLQLSANGSSHTLWQQWHWQCIEQGIAIIDAQHSAQFTPHELGYVAIGAVSFNKGCYRGQEIIARMHYRGTLKKHLHKISFKKDYFSAISTANNYQIITYASHPTQPQIITALIVANDQFVHAPQQQFILEATYDK